MSGSDYFGETSGCSFQNPKFQKPEKPDPKFSGNPNAHPYLAGLLLPVEEVLHVCL
jgi:hypothetical protein